MRDLIDERNERERIRRGIVKYWNVNYISGDAAEKGLDAAKDGHVDEVNDLNGAEAGVDEQAEFYNETTGSYSGAYGRGAVDEVTKGQIDQILREKSDVIRDLIEGGRSV